MSESGRRYYNSQLGRWLGRDPIEEKGGLHLYGFVGNNGVNRFDVLGMRWVTRYRVDPNDPNEGQEAYQVWEEDPFVVSADRIDDSWERERMIDAYNASRFTIDTSAAPSSGVAAPSVDDFQKQIDKAVRCSGIANRLSAANAASDVYSDREGGTVPGASNLERLTDQQLKNAGFSNPSTLRNADSGFYSAVYLNHDSGAYIVAFRGTEPRLTDVVTNLGQLIGIFNTQYRDAATVGTALGAAFAGNISGTGHSLGGGLETVASISGNFPGQNFNAAGVSSFTARQVGVNLSQANGLVRNDSVPFDFLSRGLNRLPLVPGTNGQQRMLPSPGGVPNPLSRHGIAKSITGLKNELASAGCL